VNNNNNNNNNNNDQKSKQMSRWYDQCKRKATSKIQGQNICTLDW